jgi:hypothetical protein
MIGESPTLPGILYVAPFELVPQAIEPEESRAIIPIVSCPSLSCFAFPGVKASFL